MRFWTTTHILHLFALIPLTVGVIYRLGGPRKWWGVMKTTPVGGRVERDPRYWWADAVIWLGLGLAVLGEWRFWRELLG
jgi:hypothetical protein